MKLIGYTFLLLVVLHDSYCGYTASANKSSSVWGYNYSLNDSRGYTVKLDDKGFGLEPIYNETSSDLKKQYESWLHSDHFTSPGVSSNDSQTHISTTDQVKYSRPNFTPDYESNGAVEKLPNGNEAGAVSYFDRPGAGESSKDFLSVPITKTHVVAITEETNPLYRTPVGGESIDPSHGPQRTYITKVLPPSQSQNTLPYVIPTAPLYYPYYPSNSPMYTSPGDPLYNIPNGPASWQNSLMDWYWSLNNEMYVPPISLMNGYRLQNGQMYWPPTGPTIVYRPQDGQINVPLTGPTNVYRPQDGQMNVPSTGPTNVYRPQDGQMNVPSTGPTNVYRPQDGQINVPLTGPTNVYRPQDGQMNVPSTGPTNVYRPQDGQMNVPSTGPTNVYRPQDGQMNVRSAGPTDVYRAQNGQSNVPSTGTKNLNRHSQRFEPSTGSLDGYKRQNGNPENYQTYDYPTKSSYGSHRN